MIPILPLSNVRKGKRCFQLSDLGSHTCLCGWLSIARKQQWWKPQPAQSQTPPHTMEAHRSACLYIPDSSFFPSSPSQMRVQPNCRSPSEVLSRNVYIGNCPHCTLRKKLSRDEGCKLTASPSHIVLSLGSSVPRLACGISVERSGHFLPHLSVQKQRHCKCSENRVKGLPTSSSYTNWCHPPITSCFLASKIRFQNSI